MDCWVRADEEKTWDTLIERASRDARPWLCGDVNAEVREVVESRRHRMQAGDLKLEKLRETVDLNRTGRGRATHRCGGEIDVIMVPAYVASRITDARLDMGISGNHHMLVWAEYTYHADTEGSAPGREKGPPLHLYEDEDWRAFKERAGETARDALAMMSDGVVDRMRALQNALLEVSNSIVKEIEERKKAEREERKKGKKEKTPGDTSADEVPPEDIQSTWEAEVAEAENEEYATMHEIEDEMMRDEGSSSKDHNGQCMDSKVAAGTVAAGAGKSGAKGRRQRSGDRETHKTHLESLRSRLGQWDWHVRNAEQYGGGLISDDGKHPLMKEDKLRAILTDAHRSRKDRRRDVHAACRTEREAVQHEFDTCASAQKWKCEIVEKVRKLITSDRRKLTKGLAAMVRVARGGGAERAGGKLVETYIGGKKENGIATGAEDVRGEARAQGAEINKKKSAYTAVVRYLKEWVWRGEAGRGGKGRERGDGLLEACSWANFLEALSKCQMGKAVGVDGFNVYLIRKAPLEVQRAYW